MVNMAFGWLRDLFFLSDQERLALIAAKRDDAEVFALLDRIDEECRKAGNPQALALIVLGWALAGCKVAGMTDGELLDTVSDYLKADRRGECTPSKST